MSEQDEMATNEMNRDEGYSTEEREAQRQIYAAQIMEAEKSYRMEAEKSCRNNVLGQVGQQIAGYQRPDYDIRASCLEAAVRIASPERDVLADARAFYTFLVEKPAQS